jgi:hypothetical protein
MVIFLFRFFGFIAPKDLKLFAIPIFFSWSVPDEGLSRNAIQCCVTGTRISDA